MGDIFFCHASNLVGFNLNLCIFTYYVYIYIHMDIGMLLLFQSLQWILHIESSQNFFSQ